MRLKLLATLILGTFARYVVEGDAGGGTATPVAGAAAPADGAQPAAPGTASATPAAAGEAKTPAPGAGEAAPDSLIGGAKAAEAPKLGADGKPIPAPAAEPTKEERAAYLTGKGLKPEELAKLDEAGLKTKYDEAKAADAKADAVSKIEIKVPEGTKVDDAQMNAFKEVLADANLSPTERGQKLADMHLAAITQATEAPVKLWMDTQQKWQDQVKADPELGGANLPQTQATIARALDALVPDPVENKALREAFIFTGAGNHPAICKLMYRAGKMLSEGGHIDGKSVGGSKVDNSLTEAARNMYPSASDGHKPS